MPLSRPFPLAASHWGAFRAEVEEGKITRVHPFEHDPRPSRMNEVWPEMLDSPLRVARPVVRRGWLEGDGGAGRGEDSYVALPWDEALDIAAGWLEPIREDNPEKLAFFTASTRSRPPPNQTFRLSTDNMLISDHSRLGHRTRRGLGLEHPAVCVAHSDGEGN